MKCSACGHANPAGVKFCLECGAPAAARCTGCGGELLPGAKFCGGCGARVVGVAPAAKAAPAPERAPRDYTPRHLADRILQSRSALEGERKHVTVLFADVKGSMELAEQAGPEVWHAILERFFEILADGVHRFEGTVNQYTGDGIMALFGAPIAHEDHAQRACYAALQLLERLREYGRTVRREHGLDFATRIGLNSGEVVVGKIGDDLRMDYTAQGHTVGLAQRVESLAEADACFLSQATADLVSGYFALEDLGDFRVKGSAEPLRVHRLAGVGTARNRFDVSRSRGLSRFVGRAREVHTLGAALEAARAGHGAVVGVVAQAGTGKSRLCYEFLESVRAAGFAVHEGRAVAHGKTIPLIPVLEIFRSYFVIEERDDDRTAREKIAGRLLLLDEGFRDVLPVLFDFLGVADPAQPLPRMEAEARQRQLTSVSRRLFQQATAERPGLLLIEDLHWLDGASEAWLHDWVDAVSGTHGLLLVNYRPEYRAEWMARSHVQQIALTPLGAEAIRELLGDLLGPDPSTVDLGDAIHARSGGNPFFAEEIVRSLIESGHLEGERGRYRLVTPIAQLPVPGSVQALLAARIDRLPEREKRVLQTAAVIGKEFRGPILEQVIDLAPNELAESLAALRSGEFVYEESLYPIAEYSFKHPLTQEVALASLLGERRRTAHAAVARATEAFDADRLDEQAALLAHHYGEAGLPVDAARWHGRAAAHVGKSNFAEARRNWQRVRELLRAAPDEPAIAQLGAIASRALLALSIRFPLEPDEARRIFEEGRRWATASGDPQQVALLHQALSVADSNQLRLDSALEHAAAFAEAIGSVDDPELRTMAFWPSLVPLRLQGHLAEHRARAEAITDRTRENPEWGVQLWASTYVGALMELGMAGTYCDSLLRARASLERGAETARRIGDPESESWCCSALVHLACFAGEPDRGRANVQRAFELSEQLGTTMARAMAQTGLAEVSIAAGDFEAAADALGEGAAIAASDAQRMLVIDKLRIRIHLERGDAARARADAEAALADLLDRGLRLVAAEAALTLVAALRAEGRPGARQRIEEALATADRLIAETGACNLAPFVLLERAALVEADGDEPQRRALLEQARAAFVEMGAHGRARAVALALGA
jgi:class 3 adenylate cyclase/tetratricopeptide (TPR) repeat protein